MLNLLNDMPPQQVSNAAAAAQTEIDSGVIDLQGFDSCCFVVSLATVMGGCVLTLQAQDNSANSPTGMANVGSPATYTDAAGESSNTLLVVDVLNIQQRYVRAKLTRTMANAAINCILAIPYNGDNRPASLPASVIAGVTSNATS